MHMRQLQTDALIMDVVYNIKMNLFLNDSWRPTLKPNGQQFDDYMNGNYIVLIKSSLNWWEVIISPKGELCWRMNTFLVINPNKPQYYSAFIIISKMIKKCSFIEI